MKQFIRRWLGLNGLEMELILTRGELIRTREALVPALNTLVVKLTDEFDPARKALSDEIGAKAIKRAQDEDWARRHTLGEI